MSFVAFPGEAGARHPNSNMGCKKRRVPYNYVTAISRVDLGGRHCAKWAHVTGMHVIIITGKV